MTRVVLEHVTKRFGNDVAVDDLSLEIHPGEFFSLLGPSGCGKTTTMRLIAGLDRPDEGRILIGDTVVVDAADGTFVPASRRKLGMVFQNYALWPHMTVRENILFGLEVRKVKKADRDERFAEVIDQLQITNFVARYPNELSGGQQQRIALARELVTGAEVLLMDEPLSNLDAKLRIDMRVELKRLHTATGKTVIYVTHDQVEALTLSERMAVMKDGEVQQVASPDDVFMRPANMFVASFMGQSSINTFEGRLRGDGIEGEGFSVTGIENAQGGDRRVIVAARPEELRATQEPSPASFRCEIISVMPMGYSTLLYVRMLDASAERFVTIDQDRRDGHFTPGDTVWAAFDMESLHVFDEETQARI